MKRIINWGFIGGRSSFGRSRDFSREPDSSEEVLDFIQRRTRDWVCWVHDQFQERVLQWGRVVIPTQDLSREEEGSRSVQYEDLGWKKESTASLTSLTTSSWLTRLTGTKKEPWLPSKIRELVDRGGPSPQLEVSKEPTKFRMGAS